MSGNAMFPGSMACKRPQFSEHGGRTWDYCKVIAADGTEHEGLLDTSWGHYFYFRTGDGWRKAKCDDYMDGLNGTTADFRGKKSDFVNFGDVARQRLGMQCQYACRYTGAVKGDGTIDPDYWKEIDNSPCFGVGLRFRGSTKDYHSMEIHKDDVEEFVRRVQEYRKRMGH